MPRLNVSVDNKDMEWFREFKFLTHCNQDDAIAKIFKIIQSKLSIEKVIQNMKSKGVIK